MRALALSDITAGCPAPGARCSLMCAHGLTPGDSWFHASGQTVLLVRRNCFTRQDKWAHTSGQVTPFVPTCETKCPDA